MDILLELLGVFMAYGRLIGGGIIMASVLLLIGLRLIIHTFEICWAVVERLGFGRFDRRSIRGGQPCSAKCC